MMNRELVFQYIKNTYKVEPDYPFKKGYNSAVLRHQDTRKWFALVMEVEGNKLGYDYDELIDIVTMKSDPMLIDGLVSQDGVHRAYHMNKKQWISVELGTKVSEDTIHNLIDLSFELTQK